MSAELLRRTLIVLSSPAIEFTLARTQKKAIQNVFILLQELQNPKNIKVLITALIQSKLWLSSPPWQLVHLLCDYTRYLSSERATSIRHIVIEARSMTKYETIHAWTWLVLLTALIHTEMREHKDAPSFFSKQGQYVSYYLSALKHTMAQVTYDVDQKAAILVSLSYVAPYLSSYQWSKLDESMIPGLLEALYLSDMVFSNPIELRRGFRELGLLTNTLTQVITSLSVRNPMPSLDVIQQVVLNLEYHGWPKRVQKTTMISITAVVQELLAKVIVHRLSASLRFQLASSSLFILRRLQHFNDHSSVFESWRFIFNVSIDQLLSIPDETKGTAMTRYLEELLIVSPLSCNPLASTKDKSIFSARQDAEDIHWILLLLEVTASSIKEPCTLRQVFSYCYAIIAQSSSIAALDEYEKDSIELSHSVLLSLFITHFDLFADRAEQYVRLVLSPLSYDLSDRQFRLVVTTMYQHSLASRNRIRRQSNDMHETSDDEIEEDPFNLLSTLALTARKTVDSRLKDRMILSYIDSLPLIPKHDLMSHLHVVSDLLRHDGSDAQKERPTIMDQNMKEADSTLEARFLEVCTTQMSSERALVCVKFLLSRRSGVRPLELAML